MESSTRVIKIKNVTVGNKAYKKYMKLVDAAIKNDLAVDLSYDYDQDIVHPQRSYPDAKLQVSGTIEVLK